MALKIWLPLNGDLKNIGTDRSITFSMVNTTSTTENANGKIDSCYGNNSNTGGGLISSKTIDLGMNQSMFCWVKFTSLTSGSNLGGAMITQHRYGNNTGMGLTIKYVSATTGYLSINTGTGSSRTYNTYCGSTLLSANTWYHVGFTYNGSIATLYVNGSVDGIHNIGVMSVPEDYIGIFAWSFNGTSGNTLHGNYKLNGYLNDVRIYDHCLSALEVKEISQGLILHYKLDEGVQPNILTSVASKTATIASGATYAYTGFWYIDTKYTHAITKGTTITIEYDYSVTGVTASTSYLYSQLNTTIVSPSDRIDYTTLTNTPSGHHKGTFKVTAAQAEYALTYQPRIRVRLNTSNEGASFTISNIKVYFGDAKDTIKDSSGYEHNGSIINSPTMISSNSGKYGAVTSFDGIDNGVLIENLNISNIINSSVTYSFWIKPNGENNVRSVYFGSYPGTSWSIEKTTTNLLRLWWNGSPDETCTGATISDGVWQHICIVKNSSNDIKVYINGTQKWASTVAHNTLTFPTTFRIGRDTRSGDNTPYKGEMSDFRIYATALSVEDVLALYNTPANIDNLNGIHGLEFVEDQENSINKNGQVKTGEIFENLFIKYDTNIYEEPDGSTWVRIFHHNDPTTSGYFTQSADWEHGVYINENKWYNVEQIPYMPTYEFMVKQKTTSTATEYKYRWTQNINPNDAVWENVKPGTVTYNTSSGYTNSTMGGLWRRATGTRMSIANTNSGNWYGALGSWTAYQTNQVPGFPNSNISTGYIDLYIRVYGLARIAKDLKIYANKFIEK